MTWTTETPTKKGYYWHRCVGERRASIVWVFYWDGALRMTLGGDFLKIVDVGGQWAGPIPEPEEPKEDKR